MSIEKRKNGTYQIEFECGGKRYRKVVAATTDAQARRLTKEAKAAKVAELAAMAKITRNAKALTPLDIDGAFARYFFDRVGRPINDPPTGLPRDQVQIRDSLINMRVYFAGLTPPITSMLQIDDDAIIQLVRWRAAQCRWGKPEMGPVAPAQVNTTTVKRLRAVFTHARKVWKLELPNEPLWGERALPEPRRRKRILGDVEQITLLDELAAGYDKMLAFSLASGLRLSESLILWADVDMVRHVVTRRIKFGDIIDQPLTPKACAIIESCRGDHPTHVFTYVAQRTLPLRGLVRGQRYPLTGSGLACAFRRARLRAGVLKYKWHDNRRTAATEVYRVGGIKAAQGMLRHKDPMTTDRYIVISDAEVRAAMTDADDAVDARLAATRQLMAEQAPPLLLPAPKKAMRG